MEYVIHPKSLVHFSIYTLLGIGSANFVKDVGPVTKSNEQVGESDFMFVLDPAANAELSVTKWLRLNAGVSYRLTSGAEHGGLNDGDFSGMGATLAFKFGRF